MEASGSHLAGASARVSVIRLRNVPLERPAEVGAQHVGLPTGVGGSPEAPPLKAPFRPPAAPGETFTSSRGKWENQSADPKRASAF